MLIYVSHDGPGPGGDTIVVTPGEAYYAQKPYPLRIDEYQIIKKSQNVLFAVGIFIAQTPFAFLFGEVWDAGGDLSQLEWTGGGVAACVILVVLGLALIGVGYMVPSERNKLVTKIKEFFKDNEPKTGVRGDR